jgi:hypothetical protein
MDINIDNSKPVDVLALLNDRKITGGMIAQALKISPEAVYNTINMKGSGSRRIRVYISSRLRCPPSILFSQLREEVKMIDDFHFSRQSVKS